MCESCNTNYFLLIISYTAIYSCEEKKPSERGEIVAVYGVLNEMARHRANGSQAYAVRAHGGGNRGGNELVPVVPRVLRTAVGHGHREPIATLEQALWRLVQILIEEGDVATDALRHSVDIVACVFWMDPSAVWAGMNAKRKEIL